MFSGSRTLVEISTTFQVIWGSNLVRRLAPGENGGKSFGEDLSQIWDFNEPGPNAAFTN
jgi:hypothetical protein